MAASLLGCHLFRELPVAARKFLGLGGSAEAPFTGHHFQVAKRPRAVSGRVVHSFTWKMMAKLNAPPRCPGGQNFLPATGSLGQMGDAEASEAHQ